jgi:hypothetical protein
MNKSKTVGNILLLIVVFVASSALAGAAPGHHNNPKPSPSTDAPWPPTPPAPSGINSSGEPADYVLVGTKNLKVTMDGAAMVDWETYAWQAAGFPSSAPAHPRSRTNVWFKGTFRSYTSPFSGTLGGSFADFDLFLTGLVHRDETVYVRFTPGTVVKRTVNVASPGLPVGQTTLNPISAGPLKGFIEINPPGNFMSAKYDVTYTITGGAVINAEAFFYGFPVGIKPAQEEDGGSPPGSPSDLN